MPLGAGKMPALLLTTGYHDGMPKAHPTHLPGCRRRISELATGACGDSATFRPARHALLDDSNESATRKKSRARDLEKRFHAHRRIARETRELRDDRAGAGPPMLFAGSDGPVAFLELKSVGLPARRTKDLSEALCQLIEGHLGIPRDRVYVKFIDVKGAMWGWKGDTF